MLFCFDIVLQFPVYESLSSTRTSFTTGVLFSNIEDMPSRSSGPSPSSGRLGQVYKDAAAGCEQRLGWAQRFGASWSPQSCWCSSWSRRPRHLTTMVARPRSITLGKTLMGPCGWVGAPTPWSDLCLIIYKDFYAWNVCYNFISCFSADKKVWHNLT